MQWQELKKRGPKGQQRYFFKWLKQRGEYYRFIDVYYRHKPVGEKLTDYAAPNFINAAFSWPLHQETFCIRLNDMWCRHLGVRAFWRES